MFKLIEQNIIKEVSYGSNFTYVFNDNKDFLLTDYKVLQNQNSSDFVKCMKIKYNGKIGISYICEGYKPFVTILPKMNADSFLVVVINIIKDIVEVKKNGFLSCENIDLSLDKIFIEPNTLKVHLIYMPIIQEGINDFTNIESELRTNLIKVINNNYNIQNHKVMHLMEDLANGMLTLEDILNSKKSVKVSKESFRKNTYTDTSDKIMKITSINTVEPYVMIVDKKEYKIGKNPALVDGVISFNKAISRVHCKIINDSGNYYIEDLNSSNGTYLNRKKVEPGASQLLQDGDIIRLANSDFRISF